MADKTEGLEHVYGADNVLATRDAYQNWAARYDAENIANGYRVPWMGAAFAARHLDPGAGPILDAGCGTGLLGEALSHLGYRDLVGADLSPEMLKCAETLGVYGRLFEQDLGTTIAAPDNAFAAVTCFGSLGPGHAPPDCLDEFIRVTRPGGHVVFNVRADTYVEQGFKTKIDALTDAGVWRPVDRSDEFRAFLLAEPALTVIVLVFEIS